MCASIRVRKRRSPGAACTRYGNTRQGTILSAATVAVMPEARRDRFELKDSEVKMETAMKRWQVRENVNKAETKVLLTHIPTGNSSGLPDRA